MRNVYRLNQRKLNDDYYAQPRSPFVSEDAEEEMEALEWMVKEKQATQKLH